jgi:hypothetical protein
MHNLALILAEEAIRRANEDVRVHRQMARERASNGRSRGTGLRAIASAISGLPQRLTVSVEPSVTPRLSEYPYRA